MQLKRKAYTTAIIALLTLSLVLAAVPIQPAAASSSNLTIEFVTTPDPYPMVNTTYTMNFTILSDAGLDKGDYIIVTFPDGYEMSTTTSAEVGGNTTTDLKATVEPTQRTIRIENDTQDWLLPIEIQLNVSYVVNPKAANTYTFNITAYSETDSIKAIGTYNVTIYEAKLVFIEAPNWIVSTLNNTFTVQAQNASGYPITLEGFINVTLSTDSDTGRFYNTTEANAEIGHWTIIGNENNQSSFYYYDPLYSVGKTVNITASYDGWTPDTVIIPLALGPGGTATVNVGDKILIANYTGATPGGEVKVYWDAVKEWDGSKGYLTNTYAESDGSFSVEITVPEAVAGSYAIYVYDVMSSSLVGDGVFATVTVEPEIILDPDYGLPGDIITVNGTGFAGESTVTLYLGNDTATNLVKLGTVVTGSLGSFSTTFDVPEETTEGGKIIAGTYTVYAVDDKGNDAGDSFEIRLLYIKLEPDEGLVGTEVTVTGRGFTPSSTVDIYFGIGNPYYPDGFFQKVKSGVPTDSAGDFTTTFIVPEAIAGTYEVAAEDAEGVIANASFTVRPKPEITVTPESQVPGKDVRVVGTAFTADSTVDIYLDSTLLKEDVQTDSNGGFNVTVTIPEDATVGEYTIKAEDAKGLSATATLNVVEKRVILKTRSDTYAPGQKVSFYLDSTLAFKGNIEVTITDPDGIQFASIELAPVESEEGTWYLRYDNCSFGPLPDDAPEGTWNWTATYTLAGEEEETEVTGQFTVKKVAVPGFEDLATKVSALEQSMTELSATVEELKSTVDTLSTAVTAMNIQVLSEAINSVKSDVTSLKSDLESVKSDVSEVSDAVSDVQSAVQNAVDAASEAKTAAENASAAVSNISTAVYGAVILSLIAAVASIMAVVTLQRKIAG